MKRWTGYGAERIAKRAARSSGKYKYLEVPAKRVCRQPSNEKIARIVVVDRSFNLY